MPCRDYYDDEAIRIEQRHQIDMLTDLLCQMCRLHDMAELPFPAAVRRWWEQHQAADRQRKADDAAREKLKNKRKAALAKLSKAERALLGLSDA